MKFKTSIVLTIILSVFVCSLIVGYVFLKKLTSDEAIKTKIISTLEGITRGKLKIEDVHFDLFKGLELHRVKFEAEKAENLRIEAEKIFIQHEPLALLRGELLINNVMVISPELFAIRDKEAVWKYLNGIKAFLDHAQLKFPTDHLRSGIAVKDLNVHIFDKEIFREGALNIEDVSLFAQPFGGSLRDVNIKGNIYGGFWEGFEFYADINFATPELKLFAQLRDKIMTEALMREVPAVGEKLWRLYSPLGKFNLLCNLDFNNKDNQRKMSYRLGLDIIDAQMVYVNWPILVKNVNGIIEMSKDGIYLKSLKGSIQNEGQEPSGEIDAFFDKRNAIKNIKLNISNINITKTFMNLIPDLGEKIWIDYKPKGNIDMNLTYESNKDKSATIFSIEAICKGISVKPPYIPYELSNIVGIIEMDGENIYFKNMNGNLLNGHKASRTTFDGIVNVKTKEKRFTVSIPNLDLTEEIIKSIPEKGEDIWSENKPTGQVDLTINYTGYKDSSKDEYLITADCKGNEFESTILPIKVSDVMGRIVIDKNNIQLKSLRGYVVTGKQFSRATCNGVLGLRNKNKKVLFDVLDLKVTEDLLDKFPELLKNELFRIEPEGWVDINIDFESKDIDPQGSYSIVVDTIGSGIRLKKIPISISDIDARVNIENKKIVSREFNGTFSGGRINGTIDIDRTSTDGKYMGRLRFRETDLAELVEKYFKTKHKLTGICEGKIEFHGKGKDLKDFVAEGRVKLKEGYISEVPPLLSIMNLLNLSIPTKETFHSADIKYTVENDVINIKELKVLSNTMELGGLGKMGFDGTLDLMVVAGFSQEMFSQIPIIGQVVDYVVAGVRKKLTKVQITGTFSNPKSTLVTLKPFKHPIKSFFELLSIGEEKREGSENENPEDEVIEGEGFE
ncbi:MAG: AsmA-like C-terminal domain-containing protein [Candidatus Scalinduaceae bacterium]